jgi:hypothetical protein
VKLQKDKQQRHMLNTLNKKILSTSSGSRTVYNQFKIVKKWECARSLSNCGSHDYLVLESQVFDMVHLGSNLNQLWISD